MVSPMPEPRPDPTSTPVPPQTGAPRAEDLDFRDRARLFRRLEERSRELAPLYDPAREEQAWAELLGELGI